jgi:hypothetical protein
MPDRPAREARAAVFLPLALLLLPALLLPACGTRVAKLYERVAGSPNYARVTEAYTRSREVRDGLETRFILHATWLSPEWFRAFEEEYASIYYLDPGRAMPAIDRWREESAEHALFFVALYTPDDRMNDLDKADTLWTLHLVRPDEKEFAAVSVRRTALRPAEVVRFFPHAGTWFRGYEVAFPKEVREPLPARPDAPSVKLVLIGIQGRAVLVW